MYNTGLHPACSKLDTTCLISIALQNRHCKTDTQKIVLQLSVFSVILIWQPKPELEALQAFIDRPVRGP